MINAIVSHKIPVYKKNNSEKKWKGLFFDSSFHFYITSGLTFKHISDISEMYEYMSSA